MTSFACGPASLPPSVVETLQQDVLEWGSSGQSVLSLPFTSPEFDQILQETEADIRLLLSIPAHYRVLFLQGGAYAHFSVVPMNLATCGSRADYVETGHWSRRAIAEASAWVRVRKAAEGDGRSLPEPDTWRFSADAAYVHYTTNETADGMQFAAPPDTGALPLVADMSADLLLRRIPVERFAVIYASAQKNLGAAGLTVVIIREDLLRGARPGTPAPFDYTCQAKERSKVNTPPTFAIAIASRMLRWMISSGGLEAAETRSLTLSHRLYSVIDRSGFYTTPVSAKDRSRVNVRFHLPSPELEKTFVEEARASGILYLRGHPSVGGMRANLYRGVPDSAVDALVAFMSDFECRWG